MFGDLIAVYESKLNGRLELWRLDGKLILNSKNANQSFDSLHRVFQKTFQKINLLHPQPKNILLLGLGAGSVVDILINELKLDCKIDAIEHDETMIEIAKKHFNIDKFSDLNIIVSDAYKYVSVCNKIYDLIIVDLFKDDQIEERFFDESFNQNLLKLSTSGKIIFNTIQRNEIQKIQFENLKKFYISNNKLCNEFILEEENKVLVI